MPSNIPAPRVPMIDARSGLVNRQWYAFFLNLFDRTSTGTNSWSIADLMVGPPVIPSEGGGGCPTGMVAFFPEVTVPPSGWEEYVPLRGKFPRGMPSGGTPGATGGSNTHTHAGNTSNNGAHTHSIGVSGKYGSGSQFASDASGTGSGGGHTHTVTTDSVSNVPEYVDGMWCRKL